jgi:Ni,Fe-hydrogenase III large subunit
MSGLHYISLRNNQSISLNEIPVLPYPAFFETMVGLLQQPAAHCVNYFAYPEENGLQFLAVVADDQQGTLAVLGHTLPQREAKLRSLSRDFYGMHIFEREIHENFGVDFIGHPWLKPVRYAFDRADRGQTIANYPFYQIESQELHQVGVGPIHAGVIEPGHFRFLCNGETVLHLEIQLGWQHRGIEKLFLSKPALIQRMVLAESIAGDTAVGHALAFVHTQEALAGIISNDRLAMERCMGLELERIAMHIGDLSNMNIGLAYQLASSVFGTLRTPVINYTQTWCGNRFGKGLIRVGGTHYPFTEELAEKLQHLLIDVENRFTPMANRLFALPTVLMRMENIGQVTEQQMRTIGAVGMSARMVNIPRDIRVTHPFDAFNNLPIEIQTVDSGDVLARAQLRRQEIETSVAYLRSLAHRLSTSDEPAVKPVTERELRLKPSAFSVSLIEGWRGEICHCCVTDKQGQVVHYKIKDPSVHNWLALALSLRDLEISDFPINNKSYNLSYCGHDL